MHNISYKSALARRVCRYSDARPPRKTDGIPPESEIPPRMRGKGEQVVAAINTARITPAYAGKRWEVPTTHEEIEDHPRICGEKPMITKPFPHIWGSPPHMRGKAK